jgi:hypothetical protein
MSWKREGFFKSEREEEIWKAKIIAMVKIAAIVYGAALVIMLLKNQP